MSEVDRLHWNERYTSQDAEDERAPVARLAMHEHLLRPNTPDATALDLACGTGRNSFYLAQLGYVVHAWDVSDVAIERLRTAATRLGLAEQIRTQCLDLDEAPLAAVAFDLVVDTYFLDRRLWPAMAAAVRPGGLLFLETLLATPQKPGRPDYYLQFGEIRSAFPAFTSIYAQENEAEGWAALLAHRNAPGGASV